MVGLCTREITSERQWDEFVQSAPNGHLLQSWGWGEFKRRRGWQPVRLAVLGDGRILAGVQVLLRSIAGISLAYVPRGPVASPADPAAYSALLEAIHHVARRRHSAFLKVEPNEPASSPVVPFLCSQGFVRSTHTVQARASIILDLTGGEEAVLARMKSKTRYNLRLAERKGVVVRTGHSTQDMGMFQTLSEQTGARDGFPIRPLEYYSGVLQEFRKRDQAELFLAEYDGQVLGGLMVFAYGAEGIYMYGASSDEHRNVMPNYLLQWRAIQWCMERGCRRYDFWGIPEAAAEGIDDRDELAEKNVRSGLWGVYRFKQGFGGQPILYTGAYDYPYIRPLYLAWSHLRRKKEL